MAIKAILFAKRCRNSSFVLASGIPALSPTGSVRAQFTFSIRGQRNVVRFLGRSTKAFQEANTSSGCQACMTLRRVRTTVKELTSGFNRGFFFFQLCQVRLLRISFMYLPIFLGKRSSSKAHLRVNIIKYQYATRQAIMRRGLIKGVPDRIARNIRVQRSNLQNISAYQGNRVFQGSKRKVCRRLMISIRQWDLLRFKSLWVTGRTKTFNGNFKNSIYANKGSAYQIMLYMRYIIYVNRFFNLSLLRVLVALTYLFPNFGLFPRRLLRFCDIREIYPVDVRSYSYLGLGNA